MRFSSSASASNDFSSARAEMKSARNIFVFLSENCSNPKNKKKRQKLNRNKEKNMYREVTESGRIYNVAAIYTKASFSFHPSICETFKL